MKVTTKKISETRMDVQVVLDGDDLKKARKEALSKLAKTVEVKGFRKGKVPVDVAEKHIEPGVLDSEIVDFAVRSTAMEALREADTRPVVLPNIEVKKYVPGEMVEYVASVEVLPEIVLGKYKDLKTKKPEVKIAKKEVDNMIDRLAEAYAEKKVMKKSAEDGDEVVIDFVGMKDGKEFAGGKAKDYHLRLGSHSFIPGFEEGIIGHESGDRFDLDLEFPKDYHSKDLAGQKTVFNVLVKQVNEVKKPEIDDAFAKKCGPFETVKELKDDIEKNLKLQEEQRLMEKYKDDLVGEFVKLSKVVAPEILVEDQMKAIRNDMESNAKSRGMSFEDFLKASELTEKKWEKEARTVAETRVKASLVLQTLAEKENIDVADEEVESVLSQIRENYKKSPEALKNLKDPRVRQDIRNRLRLDKTVEFLISATKK